MTATISKKAKMDNDSMIEGETANIGLLPDEILIKILSSVPMAQWAGLESVNKIFQRNIYDLWKPVRRIRFDRDLKIIHLRNFTNFYGVLEKLINRAPNIQFLSGFEIFQFDRHNESHDVEHVKLITDDFLRLISRFINLKGVSFENFYLSVEELVRFLKTSAIRVRLKELDLVHCSNYYTWDEAFESEYYQRLRRAFGQNTNLPPLRLESFCYQLKSFPVKFFPAIDTSRLTTLNVRHVAKEMAPLISRCNRLERLECSIIREFDRPTSIQADYNKLFDAISTCVNLLSITIQSDFVINDPSFFELRQNLPISIGKLGQLRHLIAFSLANQLCTGEVIKGISDNLLNHLISLKLNVNYCSNGGLPYMATKINRLKKLELEINTDGQMLHRDDLLPVLEANMSDLELLHIINKRSGSHCHLSYWPKIKKLKIRLSDKGSWYFHADAFTTILMYNFGSTLESLELLHERTKIDDSIVSLLGMAPYLRRLKLASMEEDADYVLIGIAKEMPTLEELDVENYKVTTVGVQAIIDACPKLKRIRGFYQMEALNFERKS